MADLHYRITATLQLLICCTKCTGNGCHGW